MNLLSLIRNYFGSRKLCDQPEPAAWVDEIERLRRLKAQRIALAAKHNVIALPVREM